MNTEQALKEAGRKARRGSPHHNRLPTGTSHAKESSGGSELTDRREAARLGSARLLDRLNAYYAKRMSPHRMNPRKAT